MNKLLKGWDSFWFRPSSPTALALYRILLALITLILLFVQLLPHFSTYFGPHSIVPSQAMAKLIWQHKPILNVLSLMPENEFWYQLVFALTVLATCSLLCGYQARPSAAFVWLGLLSFHQEFPWIDNGGDAFLRLSLFWLAFSNCGDAFTLGADQEPVHKPQWVERMIQVSLSATYLYAVISKLHGETWLSGSAFYYCVRMRDFFNLPLPSLAQATWLSPFFTYFALAAEVSMFSLVWLAKTRYIAITLGVLLHLGIAWSMNLGLFEWIFIAAYVLFIPASDWHKLARELKARYSYARRKGQHGRRRNENAHSVI